MIIVKKWKEMLNHILFSTDSYFNKKYLTFKISKDRISNLKKFGKFEESKDAVSFSLQLTEYIFKNIDELNLDMMDGPIKDIETFKNAFNIICEERKES